AAPQPPQPDRAGHQLDHEERADPPPRGLRQRSGIRTGRADVPKASDPQPTRSGELARMLTDPVPSPPRHPAVSSQFVGRRQAGLSQFISERLLPRSRIPQNSERFFNFLSIRLLIISQQQRVT